MCRKKVKPKWFKCMCMSVGNAACNLLCFLHVLGTNQMENLLSDEMRFLLTGYVCCCNHKAGAAQAAPSVHATRLASDPRWPPPGLHRCSVLKTMCCAVLRQVDTKYIDLVYRRDFHWHVRKNSSFFIKAGVSEVFLYVTHCPCSPGWLNSTYCSPTVI